MKISEISANKIWRINKRGRERGDWWGYYLELESTRVELLETKIKPKHSCHLYMKLFKTDLMVEAPVQFGKFMGTGIV